METYNALLKIEEFYEGNRDKTGEALKDAAEVYKQTNSPESFAFIYCRVVGITIKVLKKFSTLNEHDKESISTETLHTALNTYNNERKESVQYYYSKCLQHALINEVNYHEKAKRVANQNTKDYEEASLTFEGKPDNQLKEIELIDELETMGLNNTELAYCKYVVTNNCEIKSTDIANHMGISSSAVSQLRNKLKRKVVLA